MRLRVVSPATIRWLSLGFGFSILLALGATWVAPLAQSGTPQPTAQPGGQADGTMLLPNGWRIAPAGRSLALSTLPLNLTLSPDGKYAIVTNDGLMKPSLIVVDLANWSVKSTMPLEHAWLGLAWNPEGT